MVQGSAQTQDHGGGIDAAIATYGGIRADWLDLSTGINPTPYPLPLLEPSAWTALPDHVAHGALLAAARRFWHVPPGADVLAAPGASALIAQIPFLAPPARARIQARTYNEHAASFRFAGWDVRSDGPADAAVIVHPNNPDGALGEPPEAPLSIIDESFCDVAPERSHISQATRPGRIILKSFGKFWGLAGLRLGFAIGDPARLAALRARLGPWPVAGPALQIGTAALSDTAWAAETRARLAEEAKRLDGLLVGRGATVIGGTTLFRLYAVADAQALHRHLAGHHILTRIFPYSKTWLRLGLPPAAGWPRLEAALGTAGGAMRASASAVPTSPATP